MDGKKKELLALLVISNVTLFCAGLLLGLSSANSTGTIRVYKMSIEYVEFAIPIYGPDHVEIVGTFVTNDGVNGSFPSENIHWNNDAFNITIHPTEISTSFAGEINITSGEGVWYSREWLIVLTK